MQNGELDEGKPENKQSKLIKLSVVGKTRALRKKDKKKNQFVYPLVEKALTDAKDPNNKAARNALEELGYDPKRQKSASGHLALDYRKSFGSYYELASQARVEGDELLSYGIATTLEPFILALNEIYFNYKYNNFAKSHLTRIPIFLENMRHFGNIGSRFTAESTLDNGKPAGFSLRQAQRDGLKFLAASGNSGLLAHEVGFGRPHQALLKSATCSCGVMPNVCLSAFQRQFMTLKTGLLKFKVKSAMVSGWRMDCCPQRLSWLSLAL